MKRRLLRFGQVLGVLIALALLGLGESEPARAELCWFYVDTTNTPAPIQCVQQGDLTTACSWNPSCNADSDPSDCCTTIPAPAGTTQTMLQMHTLWHNCFGNVGVANNPPGRGGRWYAFHRQFEVDFDVWREDGHFCDPTAADPAGCKIESLEWCPGMNMPYGHFGAGLAPGSHVAGCGVGNIRPANTVCNNCIAFPQCLFVAGGGPTSCPTSPSSTCAAPGGASFPYNSLSEFQDVEEVTAILDSYFHGSMHQAVGDADGGSYNKDVQNPLCSPRDPMFWRLHKALDDVVRAWQDINATDTVVVIDRSGSMGSTDSAGTTKMDAALDAMDMFADLLEQGRLDGQENRIGVVSYSTNASDASKNMSLVVADNTLRNPGSPFDTVLSNLSSSPPNGWTSIGSGIERALEQLCPPSGDCGNYIPPAGENSRKAILLLTDGVENRPSCLNSAGASPPGGIFPSDECFGAQLDRDTVAKLGQTQVCVVGFGDAGSLNGDLLTLFAEKQSGIYMQNPPADPDGEWIDLKDFFVKCFGQLSDEFIGLDPKGTLASDRAATEPIEYTVCEDEKLTFSSGWKDPVNPGDMRLIVTSPSGALVRSGDASVEASLESGWDFSRIRLPYKGETAGTWRAHLIRPHQTFVNGFTTDSFENMDAAITLVRRQIQRLCPDGCEKVLYFEDQHLGPASSYEEALMIEAEQGLVGSYEQATSAADFDTALGDGWDLIVYAHQQGSQPESYDSKFSSLLCQGQRAIITDTRLNAANAIHECAGVGWNGSLNFTEVRGDRRLLDGNHKLVNQGYAVSAYGLEPFGTDIQAENSAGSGAISAKMRPLARETAVEHKWFVNVLVRGLSRLDQFKPVSFVRTGDGLIPTVRILPAFNRKGGYDKVDVTVAVERPLQGFGTLLGEQGLMDEVELNGELLSARNATIDALRLKFGPNLIPTETMTYKLYDDGTHGDQHAGNGYWSTLIPEIAQADGMYRLHFYYEATADACTTKREMVQTIFVEVEVDPRSSTVVIGPRDIGTGIHPVTFTPMDHLGNLWGPGRPTTPTCNPSDSCSCDPTEIVDHGDGSYTLPVHLVTPNSICRIEAFGTTFPLNQELAAEVQLSPDMANLITGREHTVTARVLNSRGNPLAGQTVAFEVSGANNIPNGEVVTDFNGEASFTYTGTGIGLDEITAWVDENGDHKQDAGEPAASVNAVWEYLANRLRLPIIIVMGMAISTGWILRKEHYSR